MTNRQGGLNSRPAQTSIIHGIVAHRPRTRRVRGRASRGQSSRSVAPVMMAVMGEMFGELVRYRGLLAMLAWRDIRVRYKQSLLGVAWAFLMPLVQTLVLYVVFRFGVMADKVDE